MKNAPHACVPAFAVAALSSKETLLDDPAAGGPAASDPAAARLKKWPETR